MAKLYITEDLKTDEDHIFNHHLSFFIFKYRGRFREEI